MSPFPSGAFSSLLLPRTRGGESPLPDLLLHAPPYLYSPFPLSPPDPRRSKREVLRGLSRFPSSHSGAGHILGQQPQNIPRLGAQESERMPGPEASTTLRASLEELSLGPVRFPLLLQDQERIRPTVNQSRRGPRSWSIKCPPLDRWGPRLITAEIQVTAHLTKLKARSEERETLDSHWTTTIGSEIMRNYCKQTDALMSLRSCKRDSCL
ncbi:uncharacterized protein Gm2977 isoform X3 [Mus musculus]|uniref:uncharacterized protein Gm3050 isoform X3 n=1 Tax=Mus musculus TaxID=10090 RepID=UPI0005ABB09F|nr:uncharacterized protein Gm3050 isoform X3 [Mus musculus]XP_011243098.1 uncharacterized protein Gm2977 isoform X3 [Mus musculus]|eukprot:XP_011243089.1 PREDICTED: uncharacterized protein Gm3050 isoform X4 [Mus musculus]